MKVFLFISSLALCLCLSACGKKSPPPTVQAVPMPQAQTASQTSDAKTPATSPTTKTQTVATPVSNQQPTATVKTATAQQATAAPSNPPALNPKTESKGKPSIAKDLDSVADAATGLSSLKVKSNVTKKIQDIQSKQNDKINSALKD